MRRTALGLIVGLCSGAWACGGDDAVVGVIGGGGSSSGGAAGDGQGGLPGVLPPGTGGLLPNQFPIDSGSAGGAPAVEQNLIALRIEPVDATLVVARGETATLEYRAYGRFANDPDTEVDLTERTVFYVPDNYLVASFPQSGEGTLTTRAPSSANDPAARGGRLTVRAQAASSDGSITSVTTSLEVKLEAAFTPAADAPEATPPLPASPAAAFAGELVEARAPRLVYPNEGVLLPPNLGRLEVHFQRGATENTLFEIRFASATADLRYYTRCYAHPDEFVVEAGGNEACAFALAGEAFDSLAASNRGAGPVTLAVRASDESGSIGASDSIAIEFAAEPIAGAVYYWTTSNSTSIERFDFGSGQSEPETFVGKNDVPNNGECVGCHALSRQGDKIAFSLGNSKKGKLVFVKDLSLGLDDPSFFTYNGAEHDPDPNRVLNLAFNPSGSEFVAVAPVNDPEADDQLFFHDGTTGARKGSLTLPFTPTHPDWSPSGDAIAMTAIGTNSTSSIEFLGGSIRLIRRVDGEWDADSPITVVPAEAGKNRYNPTFLPDGSALLFNETDQADYSAGAPCDAGSVNDGDLCDGYSDPAAKTWAVLPEAGATPVPLARASAKGVADTLYAPPQGGIAGTALMDTFPRAAPFLTQHRGKTIAWYTVSSQRRAGLREFFPNDSAVGDTDTQALLWMFAIEPARVAAGEDPSYAGFFLPFQDLSTSNHMAQWTERIVSDSPPPPAPTPPPPPPPPAPPPPGVVH